MNSLTTWHWVTFDQFTKRTNSKCPGETVTKQHFFPARIWFNMDPERVGNHKFPSHLQGAPSVWKKLKACGLRLDGWNKKRWQGIYSAHITEKDWKVMWRCWKCVLMQPIWLWPLWHMTKETQDDSSVSYRSYPLCHWRSMSSENGDEWELKMRKCDVNYGWKYFQYCQPDTIETWWNLSIFTIRTRREKLQETIVIFPLNITVFL